jgi:hypothetical protein
VTLEALRRLILATEAPTKSQLPWLKLALFGCIKTVRGCLRHDANVLAISGVEGDYDGGTTSFEDAVRVLRHARLAALVYTSPSFAEDRPKWRVLCPFAATHAPAERDFLLARLAGLFGGIFSQESWTLSQSYFFGAVRRNPSHRVEVVDGEPIDLRADLDAAAISRPDKVRTGAPQQASTFVPSQPGDLLKRRYEALIERFLIKVRNAPDGEKHFTLRDIARTIGGHRVAAGISEAVCLEMLMTALPDTVKDRGLARRTALHGLQYGAAEPFPLLEDRRAARG